MEVALQAHVKSGRAYPGISMRAPAKPLTCKDGFVVSVQASSAHYSSPRDDGGPYHCFELGYPSAADDLISEYAENAEKPTDTVYGYVPLAVVLALLEKHGGVPAFEVPA